MTEREWLEIGYDKGIIETVPGKKATFAEVYREWFNMKRRLIRPQSLDRLECTWNRWYLESALSEMVVSDVTDNHVIDFLTSIIVRNGTVSYKEYARILQIVNNVLVYAKDLGVYGVGLHDWDKIKRYLPMDKLVVSAKMEDAVSNGIVKELIYEVVNTRIYAVKQNACLVLCMNFYLGLRVGELASLTFRDFDFERGVVRIHKTESKFYNRDESGERIGTMVYRVVDSVKTVNSVREIPLLPEVRQFYSLIKKEHELRKYDSEYLAYDGEDTILVRSLDRTLRRLCQLCNFPYFNTHLIRKTFATRLHFSGVPTRVISDLLGHSEIGTTENSYILSYANNYDVILSYLKEGLKYEEKK